MRKIIENKKTGVKGFVVSEGEKVVVNINGEEKSYTVGSFKKMYKVVEIIEVADVEGKVASEMQVEEVAVTEEVVEEQVEEVVEIEDTTIEERIEKQVTLQDKVITLIKEFVDNPSFNTNQTEMEYVEKATISKVTLNKKNLIEIDVQKKAVVIYFNKSTLSQDNVNRMTKLIPDSYGWSSNALFKVVSETQLDLLQNMLIETREGKLALDKQKTEEKKAKQEKLEQKRLAKKQQKEEATK